MGGKSEIKGRGEGLERISFRRRYFNGEKQNGRFGLGWVGGESGKNKGDLMGIHVCIKM